MKRKISFAILSLLILAAGLTASKKLNYLESSLWIFRLNPEKQTDTKTDPRYDESEKSKSPGVSEGRFPGRRWRRETTDQETADSISFESAGKVREKTKRNAPGGIFGKAKGRERTDLYGTNKINLRNVVWFTAVFASFTVIAIYADQICRFIGRKRKDKHGC